MATKRRWNGYGLSFWKCKCGAGRRLKHVTIREEHISEAHCEPCKRCGDTGPAKGWPSDPWEYLAED